ncbi:SAM hydrolase/SAM-dependent halogenase family protein [Actinomadura atramentaria]|uniref:SAM hydrolase/SAM-dependent halogenase family protein n=1 Tax=Actinomadura atramentaria TaxID=1990 RepID=UPI00035D2CCE|nr:SAM-dependent chlorinase/fluorinase [Actinomadura atramentaria]
MPPFASIATDFGAAYTAICAGVVHRIAPGARVLVLSDEITPFAIVEGALFLRQALPYLPEGVHLGIVDPGVGTDRRPIALRVARGDVLVGPDNGLLTPAADALGGVVAAHALTNPAFRFPAPSTTFHGRDVFAPAAAHVLNGVDLAELGPPVAPLRLEVPRPSVAPDGTVTATVLYVDRYGSLILGADAADLGRPVHGTPIGLSWTSPDGIPTAARVAYERTFGSVPPGDPLLWTDSSGALGLAVNQGSAAERYGLAAGSVLTLRRLLEH